MLNSFNYRQHSQEFLGQFPWDISGQVLFTAHFSCNFIKVLGLVQSVNLCLMSKLTNPPQHFISQKTYLAFYFIVDFVDEQINKPKSTSMFYLPKSLCLLFFKEFFFSTFQRCSTTQHRRQFYFRRPLKLEVLLSYWTTHFTTNTVNSLARDTQGWSQPALQTF